MEQIKKHYVTTYYQFMHLKDLEKITQDLNDAATQNNIRGLIILGTEGINSTVSSVSENGLENFKQFIKSYFQIPQLMFKDSVSDKAPFRRFKVKIREEIVTLGAPDLFPDKELNHHLTPTQWNEVLKNEKDNVVVIDTRNWYETKIGTFKGAIAPGIEKFTEFCDYVDEQNIPKDKKMLIFCTGGIRCEKGIYEMQRRGYENVYQLEGGILKYLEEYPNDQFEGECFVFDHRVAVDQNLQPTKKYDLCPHCGQPGNKTIECKRCDTHQMICDPCAEIEFKKDTCSKNCAYQYQLHPDRKAPRQVLPYEQEDTVLSEES